MDNEKNKYGEIIGKIIPHVEITIENISIDNSTDTFDSIIFDKDCFYMI